MQVERGIEKRLWRWLRQTGAASRAETAVHPSSSSNNNSAIRGEVATPPPSADTLPASLELGLYTEEGPSIELLDNIDLGEPLSRDLERSRGSSRDLERSRGGVAGGFGN